MPAAGTTAAPTAQTTIIEALALPAGQVADPDVATLGEGELVEDAVDHHLDVRSGRRGGQPQTGGIRRGAP